MKRILASTAVALLALGACARATLSPAGDELDGRAFLSQSVTGRHLVPGTQIRLSFDGGQVGGHAGCNSLGAAYSLDDGVLIVEAGAMSMTEIGCDPARHEQDDWLAGFLTTSPAVTLDGDELTLSTAEATIELLDREVADPNRSLVGTTWRVDSIITGEAVSSVPGDGVVTLEFPDDSTFTAAAADCTSVGGSMEVDGDTITFGPFGVDDVACPSPWAETLEVLEAGATTYSIEAARLTIEAGEIGVSATAQPAS